MSTNADKLASEIREWPDAEKLRLVDAILTDLDKPDPEIDRAVSSIENLEVSPAEKQRIFEGTALSILNNL